jgi:hypothetical protein
MYFENIAAMYLPYFHLAQHFKISLVQKIIIFIQNIYLAAHWPLLPAVTHHSALCCLQ